MVWSDDFLSRAEPTPAEREQLAKYLLHELSHMWFGDTVTMRWWDDLWLNEAFAQFAAMWAAERVTPYRDVWAGHLATRKLAAYRVDQGPTTHPIVQPVEDAAQAASLFDAITYDKGASALRQLMAYVGEASFVDGLRAYLVGHAWGSATLTDLMDAMAAASGRDLDRWRRRWLETLGPDRLELRRDQTAQEGCFVLTATGPAGRNPGPHLLSVGAYREDHGGLRLLATVAVEVAGSATPLDLPEKADLYLVNDDDLTYGTTRPAPQGRDRLFALAGRLPTPTGRGVAAATFHDMLLAGEASTQEVLHALIRVARAERSAGLLESQLDVLAGLVEHWSPEPARYAMTRAVAALCRDLAAVPAYRRIALRALARVADEGEVDWLLRATGEDVDVHWRALARGAELGRLEENAGQWLRATDTNPDAWISALTVRAATPLPEHKASVWQALAVDKRLPLQQVRRVATAFWRAGQHDVLQPYADRYLELIPTLHLAGAAPAAEYARCLYPTHGISHRYPERADEAADAAAPVVDNAVHERGDLVRRMLRARAGA